MVWVSCGGETAADEENLGGVSYTPWHGFPGFYYPYLNQMHYLSPIVWLQFRNITPGVLIQIRSGRNKEGIEVGASNIKHFLVIAKPAIRDKSGLTFLAFTFYCTRNG